MQPQAAKCREVIRSACGTKRTSEGSAQAVRFKTQSDLQPRSGEQTEILARHPMALGNTGVTKMRVVGRGALRRGEARGSKKIVAVRSLRCRWRIARRNESTD